MKHISEPDALSMAILQTLQDIQTLDDIMARKRLELDKLLTRAHIMTAPVQHVMQARAS